MKTRLLLALLSVLLPAAAQASLPSATLEQVGVRLPSNAHLDLSLSARDSNGAWRSLGAITAGRPAFVNFVDYTCNTLCGTDLMLLADGITRAGLKPGDFRIVMIGIDPRDSPAAARKMEMDELPAALQKASTFLLPDEKTVAAATSALGFHYAYDKQNDQFAHPAAVYVLAPDGAVRSVLSPLALTADDLRSVLRPGGGLFQRLHALCYGYDPVTGVYTLRVLLLLKLAAMATLLAIGAAFVVFRRRRRPA